MDMHDAWCDGAPLIGVRPCGEIDRRELRDRVARARSLALRYDLGGATLFLVCVVSFALSGHHTKTHGSDAMLYGIGMFLVGLLAAYVAHDGASRYRRLLAAARRDVNGCTIYSFRAEPEGSSRLKRIARQSGSFIFEVTSSGLLHRYAGIPSTSVTEFPIVGTAPVPARSGAVASYARVAYSGPEYSVATGERELTAEENAELQRYFRRIKLDEAVILPVILAAYVGFAINAYVHSGVWLPSRTVFLFAVAGLVLIAVMAARWLPVRIRVGRDARDGRVEVIRYTVINPAGDIATTVAEYLVHSRIPWSADDLPATWRVNGASV